MAAAYNRPRTGAAPPAMRCHFVVVYALRGGTAPHVCLFLRPAHLPCVIPFIYRQRQCYALLSVYKNLGPGP